jgi:hypothetical protein
VSVVFSDLAEVAAKIALTEGLAIRGLHQPRLAMRKMLDLFDDPVAGQHGQVRRNVMVPVASGAHLRPVSAPKHWQVSTYGKAGHFPSPFVILLQFKMVS